jgi:hypothetical protein
MLGPMYASRRWIIAVFVFAFVVARVTGAHLHLCLDGTEPLAQLHVSDTAEIDHHPHEHHVDHHDDEDLGQSHDDVDVDALGNVVGKVVKLDSSLNAMLAWVFAFGVLLPARQPAPVYQAAPPKPPPRFLRPVLRGPPV